VSNSRSRSSQKDSLSIPSIGRSSISGSPAQSVSGHGHSRRQRKQSIHEDDEKYAEFLEKRGETTSVGTVSENIGPFLAVVLSWLVIVALIAASWYYIKDPLGTTYGLTMTKPAFVGSVLTFVIVYNLIIVLIALKGSGHILCWRYVPQREFWTANPDRSRRLYMYLTGITLWMVFGLNVFVIISIGLTFRINFLGNGTAVTADIVAQTILIVLYLCTFPMFYQIVQWKFHKRQSHSDLPGEDEDACCSC
jgi:hypothetical protein